MNNELTFNEFQPNSFDDWKKKVLKELGGKPFESLNWDFDNDFIVPPYFDQYDIKYKRVERPTKDWNIGQKIYFVENETTNKILLDCLQGGANTIFISFEKNADVSFEKLFDQVFLDYIQIHFVGKGINCEFIQNFLSYLSKHQIDISKTSGSFSSNSNDKLEESEVNERIEFFKKFNHKWKLFSIQASKIHARGGSLVQTLGYALSEGNELISRIQNSEKQVSIDDASAMLHFDFATSSSYFPEIAKYRAFRALWALVIEAYQPINNCSIHTLITAQTSEYHQTFLDQYNNLLRATSQAMSGIIGGADNCCVNRFDNVSASDSIDSLRWARNILHLLREESHFSELKDVSSGAYYIEFLTDNISEKAWELFQKMDAKGGISKCWNEFAEEMEANANRMEEELAFGQKVIVGVNKFADAKQLNRITTNDLPDKNYFSKSIERAMVGGNDEN